MLKHVKRVLRLARIAWNGCDEWRQHHRAVSSGSALTFASRTATEAHVAYSAQALAVLAASFDDPNAVGSATAERVPAPPQTPRAAAQMASIEPPLIEFIDTGLQRSLVYNASRFLLEHVDNAVYAYAVAMMRVNRLEDDPAAILVAISVSDKMLNDRPVYTEFVRRRLSSPDRLAHDEIRWVAACSTWIDCETFLRAFVGLTHNMKPKTRVLGVWPS